MIGEANNKIRELTMLKHTVENLPHMVCIINNNRDVLWVNTRMKNVMGCYEGSQCANCIEADRCPGLRTIHEGRPQSMNVERDGRVYSVKVFPIRREGEQPLALEIWSDITSETRLKQKLTQQNEKLNDDLLIAQRLQQAMLPENMPSPKDYAFYSQYHPCEAVGGDFYDVFELGEDKVAFYIADVSGHGVSAAMLTVFFAQAARSILQSYGAKASPGEALNEVWRRFEQMELEEHLYITAWMAVLDVGSGMITYSNAGHIVSPLLCNGDKIHALEIPGYPICRWLPEVDYQESTMTIEEGGKLLLYTDGLSDAWRTSGIVDFSLHEDSPSKMARVCLLNEEANNCLDKIWQGLCKNIKEDQLSDDVAMLLLHREQGQI